MGGDDGKVLEPGGDTGITLIDYAAQLSVIVGKSVEYINLPECVFPDALIGVGVPTPFAAVLAGQRTERFNMTTILCRIGQPTTPIIETIKGERS